MLMEKEFRKQAIAKKMKDLRIRSGLTQSQVAKQLDVTPQAVSNYERGKNSIEIDVLLSMCDIYKANPISVLSADAADKMYDILYSKQASLEEKCLAALGIFRIYFSESVYQQDFHFAHPQFDDYVAMLLNQDRFRDQFGTEIYSILIQKYGKLPGIPEGHTAYTLERKDSVLQKPAQRKTAPLYSSEAEKLAQDYDALDGYGKRAVWAVADVEKARCAGLPAPPDNDVRGFAPQAVADQLIAALKKEEPSAALPFEISAVALGGGEHKTEADSEITPPRSSVQVLPEKYKAGIGGGVPVPEEK